MKHSKFIIAILSAIFIIPLTSNAQEEIIIKKNHKPHHAELLIINNDLPHDSTYVIRNAPEHPSIHFEEEHLCMCKNNQGPPKGALKALYDYISMQSVEELLLT